MNHALRPLFDMERLIYSSILPTEANCSLYKEEYWYKWLNVWGSFLRLGKCRLGSGFYEECLALDCVGHLRKLYFRKQLSSQYVPCFNSTLEVHVEFCSLVRKSEWVIVVLASESQARRWYNAWCNYLLCFVLCEEGWCIGQQVREPKSCLNWFGCSTSHSTTSHLIFQDIVCGCHCLF